MSLAICVMAKAPVPGQVKTRLCPPLTEKQAAELSAAFLLDVWRAACALSDARVLLSYSGERKAFPAQLTRVDGFHQQGDDLGARIEHTARFGLSRASRVLVIGSDLPGLSTSCLQTARTKLETHDAVLGPSIDGGFYLIGLSRCPPGLLANLPWSMPNTYEATYHRLREQRFRVAHAPRFDDVDTIDDLMALRSSIVVGSLLAPSSAEVLAQITCI